MKEWESGSGGVAHAGLYCLPSRKHSLYWRMDSHEAFRDETAKEDCKIHEGVEFHDCRRSSMSRYFHAAFVAAGVDS